jgi:hypothetical protein
MHRVLNIDEIKNELYSFIVLCETNIFEPNLSMFGQLLSNKNKIATILHSAAQ